jgi:DHA3 family multidrug efflux protein-like MFS transporter
VVRPPFWVYIETHSVVATGMIGGAFSLSSAVLGPFMGTFVDRHRKHAVMMLATVTAARGEPRQRLPHS